MLPSNYEFLLENEGAFSVAHKAKLVRVAKIEKALPIGESLVPDGGAGLHFANLLVDPPHLPTH